MDGLSGLGTSWDVVKSYRTATQSPSQVHGGTHPRQDTRVTESLKEIFSGWGDSSAGQALARGPESSP